MLSSPYYAKNYAGVIDSNAGPSYNGNENSGAMWL